MSFYFCFNDAAPTDIHAYCNTLSRHAALPICRRINALVDLAHQRLRPIAGLAQTDPVASVNLYADVADVPPVPAHVPLDGIGLCGGVADHHQPLHLLVAMNTRSHGKLTDAGFRQIQDSHLYRTSTPLNSSQ